MTAKIITFPKRPAPPPDDDADDDETRACALPSTPHLTWDEFLALGRYSVVHDGHGRPLVQLTEDGHWLDVDGDLAPADVTFDYGDQPFTLMFSPAQCARDALLSAADAAEDEPWIYGTIRTVQRFLRARAGSTQPTTKGLRTK